MKREIIKAAALTAAILCLTACSSDETADPTASETTVVEAVYTGVLSRIRLGMTESKIISMMPDSVPLYYQDDFEMWSVDPDTNMEAITDYLPEGDLNYYADDSIITYYFKNQSGSPEKILTGYMEEIHGVFSQDASVKFYNDTIARLTEEYGVEPVGTMTGEQGIDNELQLKQVYDCPSATVTFYCTYTWQNVNDVEDYYGSYFAVKLMGKTIKEEVPLDNKFTPAATATSPTGDETEPAADETEPPAEETEVSE
jgi:hypothetical protein